MAVSVGTMKMTLFIAIIQVATSVATMQVLKLYCNYAGGISITVMLVDLSVATMPVSVPIIQF